MTFFRTILTGLVLWTLSGPLQGQDRITVLTEFDRLPDTTAIEWMEQEAAGLFSDAGLSFSWQPLNPGAAIHVSGLPVSVRFRGSCRVEPSAVPLASDGPMGWTQSQDGEIRPFIDLDCDRTAAMVWQNRGTQPLPLVTRAFGRALARIVAHELYHYVTQSAVHSASELFSQGMSSRDLTLPQVRFNAGEIEALRKGIGKLDMTRRPGGPT